MTLYVVVMLALSSITTINLTIIALLDWLERRPGRDAVNGQLVRVRSEEGHSDEPTV